AHDPTQPAVGAPQPTGETGARLLWGQGAPEAPHTLMSIHQVAGAHQRHKEEQYRPRSGSEEGSSNPQHLTGILAQVVERTIDEPADETPKLERLRRGSRTELPFFGVFLHQIDGLIEHDAVAASGQGLNDDLRLLNHNAPFQIGRAHV